MRWWISEDAVMSSISWQGLFSQQFSLILWNELNPTVFKYCLQISSRFHNFTVRGLNSVLEENELVFLLDNCIFKRNVQFGKFYDLSLAFITLD